ncbi:MAG: hypothetical protein DHS20C05_06360 [Hyphococcus sp.]|nr:MAG: hypothetical protein DHS20C05_06360 [Marinicaulis sp.]
MTRKLPAFFFTMFFVLASGFAVSAASVEGTWALVKGDKPDEVHVTFNRSSSRHNTWHIGRDFKTAEFSGLDLSKSGRQDVRFTLKRDAGDITGEGVVLNGSGSGVFSYTPNNSYFAELKRIGFDGVEEKQQWSFALTDVSLAFARGMAERNVPGLDADRLLGFRSVGGDLAFVDDLRAADIRIDSADTLIAFRVHDVTAAFVMNIRRAGFSPTNDQLVAMAVHEVTPEYIAEMKAAGFTGDISNLVAYRVHDVTPAFAKEIRDMGFSVSADKLVALRVHDITPDYIRAMRKEFGDDLTLENIIAATVHDVTPQFVAEIRALGLDPSFEQLIAMAVHDVTPEYIQKLRSKGITTTDVDKLVALAVHGIH